MARAKPKKRSKSSTRRRYRASTLCTCGRRYDRHSSARHRFQPAYKHKSAAARAKKKREAGRLSYAKRQLARGRQTYGTFFHGLVQQ